MQSSIVIKCKQCLSWRPSLIGQFVCSILLSLLPLCLVVILFLNALNKQLAVTQEIVGDNDEITKVFNNLKQDLNSLERATRQNWVLKSESLDTLIENKWSSSIQRIDELIFLSPTADYILQWRQLAEVLQFAQQHLLFEQKQDGELFAPASKLISEQTNWLREQNELRITKNQQQLKALQTSFINWLVALIPLTLLVGGGFLWRISGRLRELTSVIDKLGQGHWQQKINVRGSSELVELGNKLEWVQAQLYMLEQQKDTFLRHVTHELKTPLASMVEGTDLLTDEIVGPINDEQKAVLELITQSMVRLRAMIESLLSYNAIRTSKETVTELSFAAIKDKIERHFEHRLVAREQSLLWVDELPKKALYISIELLEMILIQLTSNAIKFSPEQGCVTIKANFKHGKLIISVIDQGHGIDDSEKAAVFGAFYQGKNAKQQSEMGSGLGLTIVKETVEQLNGKLSITDNEPQGCVFTAELPIQLTEGVY
ncbi:HAMP domain-containing histidine kinase [Pseudoalteromonas sp. MEBiC 03607]|uniref:sensor histidine kinase n=1 Tax=Pseudoalteromonas sp. MEBiC 03607 TaxID=2563601 RepID=UPI001094151F|nr:HAMP domain-containing sensor histidine kinase [Pseudoalteromonas sp. MEBiC 03607]TGV21411.1 HAMP domain-containing histidine kinase [Pseudoalteromonas sp. MEBiC 03607]